MNVSVIIPTRNRSALLARTLSSVLRQRDVELEVIVVDEGSTDNTPAMIAAFGDDRICVIRHDIPRGVAAARNHGADEAHGDWLAFVDDDDLWAPEKLVRQLRAADRAARDWAYAGAVIIDENGRIVHGRPPLPPEEVVRSLPRYDAIPGGGSNVVLRRRMWVDAGPFDVRLKNTEDWEMWIRLSKLGPPACVPDPLVARRLHRSNSSLDIGEIVQGTKLIEALHHTIADWGQLHRWMAESCLRNGQRWAALGQFARAAAKGEARLVAADLDALLRRRVRRRVRGREGERTTPRDAWMEAAAAWLAEFRETAQHTGDDTRTSADVPGQIAKR